ncbi:MAG: hypothetical protein OXG08_03060 [Gammaproteobacteria bacterium]|nr:hypothetical protein [Gammaproteobacteria bacterium]
MNEVSNICKILTLSLIVAFASKVASIEEIDLTYESNLDSKARHRVFSYEFADIDGTGSQKLVLIETGSQSFYDWVVTINEIQENSRRKILYEKLLHTLDFKLLVGDIDGDKEDEVILHRTADEWEDQSEETALVIYYENQQFKELATRSMDGERSAILDIDNDGRHELLIVAFTEILPHGEGIHPTEMRIYSYSSNGFDLLSTYDTTDKSIQCLTIGDVDSDGIEEIVTQEATPDGETLHQISVYDVDKSGTIRHSYSKNNALSFSAHPIRARAMRTFVGHDSNSYISVYKRKAPNVRSSTNLTRAEDMLLRIENTDGIVDLVELRGDMRLRSAALSERLPFSGEFYAEIIDREPTLILYTYDELEQVVRRSDE